MEETKRRRAILQPTGLINRGISLLNLRSMQVAQQQPYPAHSLIANHSETVPKKKDAIIDYRRGTIHEEEGESGNFAEKE
jgi:hypothetical protein